MPTEADGLVWLASVGFGGLGSALVGARSGGDLLEQRTEHLATSLNFFNIKTLKDYWVEFQWLIHVT